MDILLGLVFAVSVNTGTVSATAGVLKKSDQIHELIVLAAPTTGDPYYADVAHTTVQGIPI